MKITEEAYKHAVIVLEHCAKPSGFYASGLPGGYEATWARDSMITSLGASLVEEKFKAPFRRSIELLSTHQSKLGQIPNAVGTWNTDRRSDVTYNSIDSTLWYLIGHHIYKNAYGDARLAKQYKKNRERALTWLKYQDPNEDTLPVQQPTMDWQDAFPHKYGRVLNTLTLYYGALRLEGERKLAEHIRKIVNGNIEKYLSLYDKKRGYYLPWIWKNHDTEREEEYWFDTLGNLLAIVTGLATPKIAEHILRYIEKEKINRPYPCKAIYPPIKPGDKEWHSYFTTSDSRTPYEYLNGGIWPFIGGFYVAALVKMGKFSKAKRELERLAKANMQIGGDAAIAQGLMTKGGRVLRSFSEGGGFHEWLHGQTGKPIGNSNPYQAWSAGAYLFAYECVRQRRVLYFL